MRRKYIGFGLMSAVMLSAAPLSGTAGGDEYGDTVAPDTIQKCAVVADAGKGQVTVKNNRNDPGATVKLASSDKLVVCLNVKARVEAKPNVDLVHEAKVLSNEECNGEKGDGIAVSIQPSLAVEPGYSAKVSMTATVHADATVGLDSTSTTRSTGDLGFDGKSYAKDDGAGLIVEEGPPLVEYCKIVAVSDTAPSDPNPDNPDDPDSEHPCHYDLNWQGACPPPEDSQG